jgi:hypothetical protein
MREGPRRLLWFACIWLASLAAFAALAYGVRWLFVMLGRMV